MQLFASYGMSPCTFKVVVAEDKSVRLWESYTFEAVLAEDKPVRLWESYNIYLWESYNNYPRISLACLFEMCTSLEATNHLISDSIMNSTNYLK